MASVVAREDLRTPAVFVLETLAVAGCYYAGGRLGLMRELRVGGSVVSPVWPPTGVAVACLLVLGLRCWAGIALGALLILLHLTTLRLSSLGVLVGNTAAPVVGYLLLRRVGFRMDLTRLRDCLSLVFLGAFAAMLISSTTGAVMLLATGDLPAAHFWLVWLAWWVGDAMGVLLVAPVLLVLYRVRAPVPWQRWVEAAVLAVIAAGLVPLATHSRASLLFVIYPLLIWAALRFQLAGSMVCALFASVMATISATDRVGPFRNLSEVEVLSNLQAFNGALALTALLLSAVITEQRNTRRSVERACQELVEVLEHLTAGEAGGRPPPPPPPRREGE
ncbi:MASE1 domain-containing protein [Streptomyces edwardsiae]|uniref:MASE1 domain-containing protein n=1 Tax=Streptomyces edwardsiae TaxID=3075527 RepID=A0ABU2QAS6_9ACTN|nr:MASE1 domain-containing protein [Streptomyces sp. DSM 41635]MDT0401543.1 MASE1 domain-containing protein [Streptomyces sp. DSM 41635]